MMGKRKRLTEKEIESIYKLYDEGVKQKHIAERLGVSAALICNTLKRRTSYEDEKDILKIIFPDDLIDIPDPKEDVKITVEDELSQQEIGELKEKFVKDSKGYLKETPEAEAFKRISQENFELYKRKNIDYGNSFAEQFQEFRMQSVMFRLQDKVSRIKQLSMNSQRVSDESLIDTLRDLSNYAIMTIVELEKDNK